MPWKETHVQYLQDTHTPSLWQTTSLRCGAHWEHGCPGS